MIKIERHNSILEIKRERWQSIQPEDFPFSSYDFLGALESSGSTGKRTGWFPLIITVSKNDELIAGTCLYLKTNSYGEYIFDWSWADAWQKSGLKYYPKLLSAVPFTPATGPKILCKEEKRELAVHLIIDEVKKFATKEKISTIHFLYIPEMNLNDYRKHGFSIRKTYQFHWRNNKYGDFNDFLMELKQKKRREIRRERKLLSKENLTIQMISGSEVEKYAGLMYDFYLSTIDKKWSADYLTKDFFSRIFSSMQNSIVMFIAFKNGHPVAATLNFQQGKKLFGRYWGSSEDIPNLHFELCYYRPIEYAIENKIELFEAGAQGEHKIQRGFIPSYTYSAHLLPDHELGDAVRDFIEREALQVDRLIKEGRQMAYK